MSDIHIQNRDKLVEQLQQELVGPAPAGAEIDASGPIKDIKEDDREPYRQEGSGQEILTRDRPTQRYGAGVLYPVRTRDDDPDFESEAEDEPAVHPDPTGEPAAIQAPATTSQEAAPSAQLRAHEDDRDDFDLSSANTLRPSSMGISFLAEIAPRSTLAVEVSGGRYERKPATPTRDWWLRRPVRETVQCDSDSLLSNGKATLEVGTGGSLRIEVLIRARPYRPQTRAGDNLYLLTVSLVNRSEKTGGPDSRSLLDERCLFQSRFAVRLGDVSREGAIHPYPESWETPGDRESASIALLYRQQHTFGVGHGCAADWERGAPARVAEVRAECLPWFDTPSITPDVRREDGTKLTVRMAELAGLIDGSDGIQGLEEVVGGYERWIAARHREAGTLAVRFRGAAVDHLTQCEAAALRMRAGIEYLRTDARAREAFTLANQAMLMQRSRSDLARREATFDEDDKRLAFAMPYTPLNFGELSERDEYTWRAFQIAFLLMTIRTVADGAPEHRDTVELIWFPTGGGKTEAYLGLAAFHMFLRRLSDPGHDAVDVLMRYTLRLLTAQQFQRAATLLAAMEFLRRQRPERLGEHPFSIGLWVGGGSTPNRRADALRAVREMEKLQRDQRNPFILLRCPWCQAAMGPYNPLGKRGRKVRGAPKILGYEQSEGTVVLKCPDRKCDFTDGLPVHVIDEDIYERRPAFLIATVDKFATLAWRPEARSLFGLGKEGERSRPPPGLIIQDELHLISGPLGSMVGLYEAVIDELCTDRRTEPATRPKIVSSTATISRYREQIQALYARPEVALFPPPGLSVEDSFFGRYAQNEDGSLQPGRRYVGIHAPGLGSFQTTQVRTYASILQAARLDDAEQRDPWWTLVLFFNSLRELGTAVSLVQSDVVDHLRSIRERMGTPWDHLRMLRRIEELTGRLQDHEVPAMLESLDTRTTGKGTPVDVCLASNILEVGVDIDRLSLMAVVGQPKTTSQYIQVTGRVGRSWWERPGLILSIYSPSRPRDRSHFERFRSYHQRLYAQVEPTSVTPFSRPALERALHAVMAIYARQAGSSEIATSPYPYPEALIARLREILAERIAITSENDTEALAAFRKVFDQRASEWRLWERTDWGGFSRKPDSDIPLLRPAGTYATAEDRQHSWSTPNSLRNVDAECEGTITKLYASGDQ